MKIEKLRCSIVVLNHNGRDLLEIFMPSILDAVEFDGGGHEVIIVDNGSSDGSQEFIRNKFPSVRMIALPHNEHMQGYNAGIKASQNEIVIVLNNDIKVDRGFIRPLLLPFSNPRLFAVRPAIHTITGGTVTKAGLSHVGLCFKFGFIEQLYLEAKTEEEGQLSRLAFCVPGGAGAFDKNKFLELNGFDDLFSPFYWEDVDLSYRAWKRGWKILFEPKSVLYHQTHSTISRIYPGAYIERIAERNRYILIWKNILDKKLLFYHFCWIPLRLAGLLITGQWHRLPALFLALRELGKINARRKRELQEAKKSDIELFSFFAEMMKDGTKW